LGAISLVLIFLFVVLAMFAPLVHTSDPLTQTGSDILARPGWAHWFGTNRQGQDVYSRVIYALRPSLVIGIIVVAVSLTAATVLALLAGYFGGKTDMVISRLADTVNSFPAVLLGLVAATADIGTRLRDGVNSIPAVGHVLSWPLRLPEDGVLNLIIAISIVFTPSLMRIMRGGVLQEKNRVYVEAGRAIGCSEARLMFRQILPNLLPLVIVAASTSLPAAIITESALSFLGVGLAVGRPSLGAELSGQARQYFAIAWWMAVFPGLALGLLVLAFNFLGDSLRDTLDPRLRGTGLR
jgi:ABC-type dipeptide/oligopeptide/nickel transport system permease subunit